jgi:hypothetical protein
MARKILYRLQTIDNNITRSQVTRLSPMLKDKWRWEVIINLIVASKTTSVTSSDVGPPLMCSFAKFQAHILISKLERNSPKKCTIDAQQRVQDNRLPY